MIDFQKFDLTRKAEYDDFLYSCGHRGCEFSFANLYMWGHQEAAFLQDSLVIFSQFDRRSIYPYPITRGDIKPVLDALIEDARSRKIRFRISSMVVRPSLTTRSCTFGSYRCTMPTAPFRMPMAQTR